MKQRLLLAFCYVFLVIGIAYVAYRKGKKDSLLVEFKTYENNLVAFGFGNHPPELKEFLKGRYYYLGNRIPENWLPSKYADYGPVDTNVFIYLSAGKEASPMAIEYEAFKKVLSRAPATKK